MLINTNIISDHIILQYSIYCTLYSIVHQFTFYTNIVFDFAIVAFLVLKVVCVFSLFELWFWMSFTINLAIGECKTMPMSFLCLKLCKFRTCSWRPLSAAVLQIDLRPVATGQKTKMCWWQHWESKAARYRPILSLQTIFTSSKSMWTKKQLGQEAASG